MPSADRIPVGKAIPGGDSVFQTFQARIDGYEAGLRMKGCLASVGALTLSNGEVSPADSNYLVLTRITVLARDCLAADATSRSLHQQHAHAGVAS